MERCEMSRIDVKPVEIAKYAIDFGDARRWIEQLLGYQLRDTLNSHPHYHEWCRKHDEKPDNNSHEQYARYKAATDGEAECPEYRDYWHFLVDRCDVHNGGTVTIDTDLLEGCEPWQADITQAFIDEFGDECEYWVKW